MRRMKMISLAREAFGSFAENRARFSLSALGIAVGTASLILVLTVGQAGKRYILSRIHALGTNIVYAYYESGDNAGDFLTLGDMASIQQHVPEVGRCSPLLQLAATIGDGRSARDTLVLGVSPEYAAIRNLEVPVGRFFDQQDETQKVALVTEPFARKYFGNPESAAGQTIRVAGVPYSIVGVFRERAETFGQSEVSAQTVLVPFHVARELDGNAPIKQLFFSVANGSDINTATVRIAKLLQSRHRPESVYRVENLSQLLGTASRISSAITLGLALVSLITVVVSGIGIMNIMLASVGSRLHEIGVRRAVGATSREIKAQFLMEALFIAVSGGIVGAIAAVGLPLMVRFFTAVNVAVSARTVIAALIVSGLVGVLFGVVPAWRAATLNPAEVLHE